MNDNAKFRIGQVIQHGLFGYRGVIADVDPVFQMDDAWYEAMARSRPPKDEPWYHVLVHDSVHTTYVAERNLGPDDSGDPVRHPALDEIFDQFEDGHYRRRRGVN